MAAEHHQEDVDTTGDDEVQFIEEDDILAEVEDDGNEPMDDDDDDDAAGSAEEDMNTDNDIEDTSEQHFSSHSRSVFTISGHPIAPIAASGGEDDLGYLWDITDGELLAKLTGHTDSVTNTAFSADGEMIATGGMDGKIRVWRRIGREHYKSWEFLTELQVPDEVMWLKFHPRGTLLLTGCNDSTVWIWQLPSGHIMHVFSSHTGPVQCGNFTPDGKKILTACADGSLILWDPRLASPIFKLSAEDARFDLGGITSLGINPSSTLAVVGGANGGVRVVSLSKGEIVATLAGHKEGESVESVAFIELPGAADSSGAGIAVTGGTDGKIHIWDLSTMRLRASMEHQDAITTLLTRPPPKKHIIVSASADKTLRTWDGRTGTLLREHKGHHGPVLGASLALGGSVVLSAGDDGECLVFTTEASE